MKRFLFLLLIPLKIFSLDLKPWFSEDFMLQPHLDILYQSYRRLAVPHRSVSYRGSDTFSSLGLGLSAFQYSGELEVTLAKTRKQNFACDNFRLLGRYQLMNDLVGDPVSATAGIILSKAFKHSLKDISSFHHGIFEVEAHVAVGREKSIGDNWDYRWWGLCALGSGDRGWPWVRTRFVWEKNACERHYFGFLVDTLWGFAKRNLHRREHFRGYGAIAHQSVDLGLRYDLLLDFATLSFEYRHRVYARNFPKQANLFYLSVTYPMSPADWFLSRWLIQQVNMSECMPK